MRGRNIEGFQWNPTTAVNVGLNLYMCFEISLFFCQDFEKTWLCVAELLMIVEGIQP